ncbi:MAG: DUF134 domain-containing protein [Candidatus Cloacimonetes bacterium]|nr:DUF134 domain-containing protein [Candidatus Cloacimonadota bacterium]MBS3767388.1 DUF134 domain-containing protein [Candidatus Cloacimonadota bacterium]
MSRRKKTRIVQEPPLFKQFKPAGVPARILKRINISVGEYEALRLADYEGLSHLEAAKKMEISRPTFTRLIDRARNKIATALIEGKEIFFHGGNFKFLRDLIKCMDCGEISRSKNVKKILEECPYCSSEEVVYLNQQFRGRQGRGGRRRGGGGRHGRR